MKSEFVLELFEREQKRERKERFLRLVGMLLLAIVALSWGDDKFQQSLETAKGNALVYVKAAANLVLFFMFLAKIVPALTGSQKDNSWWEIIGIIAAVIVINTAESIWKMIAPQALPV